MMNNYMLSSPETKRSRMEGGGGGAPILGYMGGAGAGARPSKVVQIRNLVDTVFEADILDSCGQFGSIAYVQITGRGQALLEFDVQKSAEDCVQYNATTDLFILNVPVYITFAPMEAIPRKGLETNVPSNVVVVTVTNARYPITTDVISAICKPIAEPIRMVISRRSGITCYVEFSDAEAAKNIKQRLNGCDIYSGCCTLKIEFAKMRRLTVTVNNQDTWDYAGVPGRDRPGLLSEPPAYPPNAGGSGAAKVGDELGYDQYGRPIYDSEDGYIAPSPVIMGSALPTMPMGGGGIGMSSVSGGGYMGGGMPPSHRGSMDQYGMAAPMQAHRPDQYQMAPTDGAYGRYDGRPPPMPRGGGYPGEYDNGPPPMGAAEADGCGADGPNAVVMLYGLDEEKFNCDRVFNLACLFGNVARIKFIKAKSDTCMVQMGDMVAADRLVRGLNRVRMFGKDIQVSPSKKVRLEDMRSEPLLLSDGTPSYKNYVHSRCNRFMDPKSAMKNRLNNPTKSLYIFNIPVDYTEDMFTNLLKDKELPPITRSRVFEAKEGSRSKAMIADFETIDESLEVVVMANHEEIDSETSKTPYLMKFAFNAGRANFDGQPSSIRGVDRGGGGYRGRGGPPGGRGRGGGSSYDYRTSAPQIDDDTPRINGPQHIVGNQIRQVQQQRESGGFDRGRGGGRGGGYSRGGPPRGGGGGYRGSSRGRGDFDRSRGGGSGRGRPRDDEDAD